MRSLNYTFLFLPLLLIYSCKEKKPDAIVELQNAEFRRIALERGAFHYDRFVLEDSIIKFEPLNTVIIEEFPQYGKKSATQISQADVDSLFQKIKDSGFFNMRATYNNQTTDNSSLQVSVQLGQKLKTIYCDDFERDCPEILKLIEDEMVRLHGKNLKRQLLPG